MKPPAAQPQQQGVNASRPAAGSSAAAIAANLGARGQQALAAGIDMAKKDPKKTIAAGVCCCIFIMIVLGVGAGSGAALTYSYVCNNPSDDYSKYFAPQSLEAVQVRRLELINETPLGSILVHCTENPETTIGYSWRNLGKDESVRNDLTKATFSSSVLSVSSKAQSGFDIAGFELKCANARQEVSLPRNLEYVLGGLDFNTTIVAKSYTSVTFQSGSGCVHYLPLFDATVSKGKFIAKSLKVKRGTINAGGCSSTLAKTSSVGSIALSDVRLYPVAANTPGSLTINTGCLPVSMNGVVSYDMDDTNLNSIVVKSGSGDVSLKNIGIGGNIQVETDSGDVSIYVKGADFKGTYSLQSDSCRVTPVTDQGFVVVNENAADKKSDKCSQVGYIGHKNPLDKPIQSIVVKTKSGRVNLFLV